MEGKEEEEEKEGAMNGEDFKTQNLVHLVHTIITTQTRISRT